MTKSIAVMMFVILLISACDKSIKYDVDKRVIDMTQIATYSLPEIGNDIRLIPLEKQTKWIVGRTTKAIEYEDKLFILDQDQKMIFIYNCETGQQVGILNCIGKGPGEYLYIADFTINPFKNQIEIIDGVSLWTYDFESNFIGKKEITDETILAVNQIEIINEDTIAFLSLFDDNGARLYSREKETFVSEQSIVPAWTRDKIPFQTANPFYRNGDVINYFEGFSNRVYSITANGYQYKYEWDFGHYNFKFDEPPLFDDFRKADSFRDILKNREYYCNKYIQTFQHNIENNEYIVACFLFMNEPTTLIYNKKNKSYLVIDGVLSKLFMFSKIEFAGKNEILVLFDFSVLKLMPLEWFPADEQKIINNADVNSNPFIIRFSLNSNF